MKNGKVWLAGAGPGDPGLLTVKAKRLIETADVIVYDRLVGDAVLSLIPCGTERIDVGKTSGHHPVPQEEISRILLKEAQKGKKVLRLKGGDPVSYTHLDVYKRQVYSYKEFLMPWQSRPPGSCWYL